MHRYFLAGAIALSSLSIAQVAAAQDSRARSEIVVTAKYQKDWDKGNKLEAEGLAEIESAKRDLVKHSAALVNAQNLRNTSLERAANARAQFENLTQRQYFTDPQDALSWARDVEKAAANWAKFEKRTDEGASDLKKAQERQESAQSAIDKAQSKIDKGRKMKLEAEQASRLSAGN